MVAVVKVGLERGNEDLVKLYVGESRLLLLLLDLQLKLTLFDDIEMRAVVALFKEEIATLISEVLEASSQRQLLLVSQQFDERDLSEEDFLLCDQSLLLVPEELLEEFVLDVESMGVLQTPNRREALLVSYISELDMVWVTCLKSKHTEVLASL